MEILNSLLVSRHRRKKSQKKSWKERLEGYENIWNQSRRNVFQCMVGIQSNCGGLCKMCFQAEAKIECDDCFEKHLCIDCDDNIHERFPFHNRVCFSDGYERSLTPSEQLNVNNTIFESSKLT